MDVEQFQDDVREGRIDADRLVDLIVTSQQQLQQAKQQLEQAKRRIEELEKKLGGSPTVKIDEPFSLRAEERRQEKTWEEAEEKTEAAATRTDYHCGEDRPRRTDRESFSGGRAGEQLQTLAHPAGVAAGKRPGSACRLRH